MPGKTFIATKLEWYRKLGFDIKAGAMDAETVGIDQADRDGDVDAEPTRGKKAAPEDGDFALLPAHATLYRNVWSSKFRPTDDTDVIMEKIFGSGNGVHVTLENTGAEKDPRCYWKGLNFGRTPEEKKLLDEMLTFYVLRARGIVEELKSEYDAFIWPPSTAPLETLSWDPADLFNEIAALASRKTGATVVVPTQKDSALLWASAAIHPLQPLQNTYQRLVRDACRDIKNDDLKKAKEGEELGHYCYFEAAPPRLLAQPKDAEGGLEERLGKVEKDLAKLAQAIAEGTEARTGVTRDARARADRALLNLLTVRSFYSHGGAQCPRPPQRRQMAQGNRHGNPTRRPLARP